MKRILVLSTLIVIALPAPAQNNFGKYIGEIVAQWGPDGRSMTLTQPLRYIDPKNVDWVAPEGSTVDGASIPKIAWSIIGGPFEGKYRAASVIHDVACVEQNRPWKDVHYTFYTAMRASKVPESKAKVMYAAVYHFGPRWPTPTQVRYATSTTKTTNVCIGKIFGIGSGCIELPRTSTPVEGVITASLPPETPAISESDFERLKMQIESREDTGTPMSIQEIAEFK